MTRKKITVGRDAPQDLPLQLAAQAEQCGRCPLHRSADRKIGIGDQLQAFESFLAIGEAARR